MNRIEIWPELSADLQHSKTPHVDAARYEPALAGAECALFAPLHYEPNYAYPLLVWLHGPGDSQQQLKRIMPLVSMRNYVAVAPAASLHAAATAGRAAIGWQQTDGGVLAAEQRVLASISSARSRFCISPARIFIAGLASGGTMALRLALNHPRLFAGAGSFGGPLPRGDRPLCRVAEARGALSLLLAMGAGSNGYPAGRVTEDLRLLHAAGIPVTVRQYACGDELNAGMLADLNQWIMERIAELGSVCL